MCYVHSGAHHPKTKYNIGQNLPKSSEAIELHLVTDIRHGLGYLAGIDLVNLSRRTTGPNFVFKKFGDDNRELTTPTKSSFAVLGALSANDVQVSDADDES